MDLTAPAIEKIEQLVPPKLHKIHELEYATKPLHIIKPPMPAAMQIGTLKGFVDLLEAGIEDFGHQKVLVHVATFDTVRLIAKVANDYGDRQVVVDTVALKGEKEFKFDSYYTVEDFNIALRALFVRTTELDDLIALASSIKSTNEGTVSDDGISQKVTAKSGVGPLIEGRTIKPVVKLQPWRTFREVDQPEGEFIFRVKETPQGISCALFCADGGTWKLTAIKTVSEWLTNQLHGSSVAGLPDIPVIA